MAVKVGKQRFLLLHRGTSRKRAVLEFAGKQVDCLKKWSTGTRTSPVFHLTGSSFKLDSKSRRWLLFLGPIFPGQIPLQDFECAFLTLGTYNLLLISSDLPSRKKAKVIAEKANAAWEEWLIEGDEIRSVLFGTKHRVSPEYPELLETQNSGREGQFLGDSAFEYNLNLRNAILKHAIYGRAKNNELGDLTVILAGLSNIQMKLQEIGTAI